MNKTEIKNMAKELMTNHSLVGWSFKFDKARRRCGLCNYRSKTISVSEFYALNNPIEMVKNTILHEIAHVLVGSGHGHDRKWKVTAMTIGCNGDTRTKPDKVAEPKYRGICPNCGDIITTSYRRVKRRMACGRCCDKFNGGRFSEKFIITWEAL